MRLRPLPALSVGVLSLGALSTLALALDSAPPSGGLVSAPARTSSVQRTWSSATTLPASQVTSSAATLHGSFGSRYRDKSTWFQWGTSQSYGATTPVTVVPAGSADSAVTASVAGLRAGTTYHFRFVVRTATGTSYGKDVAFSTTAATPTPTTTTPAPTTTTPTPTTTTTTPAPTTTTTTTTTTPSPTSTTSSTCTPKWTSSDRFGSWSTNGYLVNNNMWADDAGPQTISACAWNRWSITSNQPGTGTDDSVKTYADTQKHVSLPLSTLKSLPSSFDVTTPAGGGTVPTKGKQWNAAYDLWLDNFGTEVMVWNNWTMNWQYWYGVNKGVQLTVDGIAYHAYTNGSGIWFVRDNVTNKGTVDLAHLLQWAVAKGWLRSSQVLGEVEYGFEVSYTGSPTTFTLNNYSLTTP